MKSKAIALAAAVAVSALAWTASATVSDYLPVGGVLTDLEGTPLDGDYVVVFSLYDGAAAVSPIWTETYPALEIDDGLFTVYLGSVTPLAFEDLILAPELWLGVKVGTDSEMERLALGAVPFAVEAYQCRAVGGLEEGDIQPLLAGENQCPEGEFLRGWDADQGEPICETPDSGLVATDWSSDGIVYTAPYSASTSSIQYRKIGDTVFLRGVGNAGGTWVQASGFPVVATLPAGFRPAGSHWPSFVNLVRCCSDPASLAYTYINTNGDIVVASWVVNSGNRQFIYFDGVNFSTAP